MTFRTRFAPSPTGALHLGHAYSALLGYDMAQAQGGTFLLRIDDLDQSRARPEWEEQIKEDLRWLGLDWPEPCRRQSQVMAEYDAALDQLWDMGVLYPCTCSRRDIREAASAPQEGAQAFGPDGLIYPGTCRSQIGAVTGAARPRDGTLRLDMSKALDVLANRGAGPSAHRFTELSQNANTATHLYEFSNENLIHTVGDIVVSRQGMGAAYHLAVVIDDAAQSVTHVVRGEDLLDATKIHKILFDLLEIPNIPAYFHHRLIRDEAGKRLAKRDDARAIARYRSDGASPKDIRSMVGL